MIKNNNFIEKIVNSQNPYFIAEIGINHNGSVELAKRMIDSASENGANCVKFQSFIADEYISKFAEKASYQEITDYSAKSQKEIIKDCELTIDEMKELQKYCSHKNIDFLSTPFEINSLKNLLNINIKAIKISSCNLTNYPFLKEAAKTKLPILLSTGMGNIKEVDKAVNIFKEANSPLLVFQCTSNYPSKIENSNINVIKTYRDRYKVPIGLSDHTQNNIAAITAIAVGAVVIEKHFTISRELPGIDQNASIIPDELKQLVCDLKDSRLSLGSFEKFRSEEEKDTFNALRRSLVASKDISSGDIIESDMISIMRPGSGLSTDYFDKIVGMKTKKNIKKYQLFKIEDLI